LEDFSYIATLLRRVLDGKATEAELDELSEWVRSDISGERTVWLDAWLKTQTTMQADEPTHSYEFWNNIADHILSMDKKQPEVSETENTPIPLIPSHRQRFWAAASVILVIGFAAYFWFSHSLFKTNASVVAHLPQTEDVAPGGNRAILILADGREISLDSMRDGKVAEDRNAEILKEDSGLLVYNASGHPASTTGSNTLITPNGGQYSVILSDGTKVWLNAASSLKYPVSFSGGERIVEVGGEAYFEVAADPGKPFVVKNGDRKIEVLGTHFNINAYQTEDTVKVTLLEGLIRVSRTYSGAPVLVRPGQQAEMGKRGAINLREDPNVESAVAWKNGYFSFTNASVQQVMEELSRWYDIQVSYEGKLPGRRFGGEIQRNLTLSQVLKLLEKSDIHFRIAENKLIVTP
jgi:ferric-dicitrate binding protein FerR (iron transport regulator)